MTKSERLGDANAPEFARLLRSHRMERGLSQGALGRISGVNDSYICRIETQTRLPPTDTIVMALCTALVLGSEDVDRLFHAAGFLPPSLRLVSPGSCIYAVLAVERSSLRPEQVASFRQTVELLAMQYLGKSPPSAARSVH